MARIGRDEMFIRIAELYARRSTCDRANVGAILVDRHHRIISTGYNGSPSGHPHCDDIGHLLVDGHCKRTVHAEENCITYAARNTPHRIKGCTLYVTHSPCDSCARLIVSRLGRIGVERLVYLNYYKSDGINILEEAGVTVEQFKE